MRILHVSQPTDGGCAVVVRQLVEGALEAGHSVSVACPAGDDLPAWTVSSGATWIPWEVGRQPHPTDLRAARRLSAIAKGFDVVHLHSSKAGALGRIVLGKTSSPATVFTPHGWSWHVAAGVKSVAYQKIERLLGPRASITVCVSDAEAEEGRRVLGQQDILTINNGVDVEAFIPPSEAVEPSVAVLSVGRLDYAKGHSRLVEAMAKLDPWVTARIVGEGPLRDELEHLIDELKLNSRVALPGHRPPLQEYHNASVVVMPSRWEGLSLALLEAMACGCAIVATEACAGGVLGDSGVVVDGQTDEEVATSLAAAVGQLLADPTLRETLGARARERVETGYAIRSTVDGYLQVYDDIVAKEGQRPRSPRIRKRTPNDAN